MNPYQQHRKEILANTQEAHSNLSIMTQLMIQAKPVPQHYLQKFPEMVNTISEVIQELIALYEEHPVPEKPEEESPEEEDEVQDMDEAVEGKVE